jgi:uncharacterized protein YbaP (TraB family)
MFKRWTTALFCLVFAGAACAESPRPLLWKVSDKDNTLYLLGSFHLLKPGDYPLAASTDAAFDDAEQVVFELSPAEMADPAGGVRMARAAARSDGRTLQESLPAATWQALQAYAATRSMQVDHYQGMDAWFLSLVISLTEMRQLGLDTELGLDKHFADRAVKAGKATRGLETFDQQIALFEGMSADEQRQALQDALEDAAEMRTEIERMHALWRAGDAEGLFEETGAELKAKYPGVYKRLNSDRNRAWLPRLSAMLDAPGSDDTLVVVGAMHLLGADGVVALLRAKGYRVERL